MVRVTCAVSSRRRRKKILKQAKGFFGDRKNHIRQTKNALMMAMAYNYIHRKKKKAEFRKLWTQRINVASRACGISYSKLIHGLSLAKCSVNRKMLADLAVNDPDSFSALAETAKKALG